MVAGFAHATESTARDVIQIPKFDDGDVQVEVDGRLDEQIWQQVPPLDDVHLVVLEPDTLEETPWPSRVYLFYTTRGLYLGVWNEQPVDTLVSRLSSRDTSIPRDDFDFTLDPTGEGLYAYWFGVNLGGTLQDGTVLPERQFNNQWDGPWDGASAEHNQGWSAEFFVPWSMMSMPDQGGETRRMGFYMSREVAHRNERWGYPALPKTAGIFLSQLQQIELVDISPKQQFTFYPFASFTWDNAEEEDRYQSGFDFYWRPTSNLQFTATVNPDFGNVESDDVVVNLTSFETFYPEKRPFFLEGNEIFVTTPRARSGHGSPTTLVNTRRIGGPPVFPDLAGLDLPDLEENQPSALDGAIKVTGQNGKFRYGALAAMEEDTKLHGTVDGAPVAITQDGRDFGIARFLYEDTASGGRRALGWITTMVAHQQGDALVHGLDGHYLTADASWNTDAQLIFSDLEGTTGTGGFVDVTWRPDRGKRHMLSLEYFDEEVDFNDLGFLRRNDAMRIDYEFELTEPDLPDLKNRTTQIVLSQQRNHEGRVVRSGIFTSQGRQFENNASLNFDLNYFPARWDDINSDGNGSFRINGRWNGGVFWGSDQSRPLSTEVGATYREEDLDGRAIGLRLNLTWRPTDRFSLVANINYDDRDGWLIYTGGRTLTTYASENWKPNIEMDFFLSSKQQFRITAQWAGFKAFEQERWLVPLGDGDLLPVETPPDASPRDFSISRLTFQARYRWELAPLSDLFVVYTRGSDVDSMPAASFNRLLRDSWTERLVDILVVKLRYRLGS